MRLRRQPLVEEPTGRRPAARCWPIVVATLAATVALAGCCGAGPGRTEPLPPLALVDHAAELERGHPWFTVVIVSPFVVIGDGRPEQVRAYAHQVVGWAGRLLQRDFFDRHPRKILNVWVFKSDLSYRFHNGKLFGGSPPSPYGYYAPCSDALVINAGLGGGTLVHEMVHALMEANFDEAPTWFDEGLASLFEQPAEREGHLVGLTNWRLPPLQRALRARRVKPLAEMMDTSRWGFYDADEVGLHYAMARYLCFWLQEQGLLVPYFRRFRANVDDDPTGLDTLQAVLGERDPERLQQRWQSFVLGLSFGAG